MDWTENEEEEEWDLSDYRLIWGTYKARVDREMLKGITQGLEEGVSKKRISGMKSCEVNLIMTS